MEAMPTNGEDTLYKLLDRRLLAKVLTRDVTCDFKALISMYTTDLVEYVFKNIIIDPEAK